MEKVVCHAFSNNGAALYQQFTCLVAAQGDVRTTYSAACINLARSTLLELSLILLLARFTCLTIFFRINKPRTLVFNNF